MEHLSTEAGMLVSPVSTTSDRDRPPPLGPRQQDGDTVGTLCSKGLLNQCRSPVTAGKEAFGAS